MLLTKSLFFYKTKNNQKTTKTIRASTKYSKYREPSQIKFTSHKRQIIICLAVEPVATVNSYRNPICNTGRDRQIPTTHTQTCPFQSYLFARDRINLNCLDLETETHRRPSRRFHLNIEIEDPEVTMKPLIIGTWPRWYTNAETLAPRDHRPTFFFPMHSTSIFRVRVHCVCKLYFTAENFTASRRIMS